MNLKHLQYLLHVAETENISQSARELFIAQPALSRLIAEAEKELGYPLFDRLGKKIVLNQNGIIFANYVRRILDEWGDMQKEIGEYNRKPERRLTVGAEVCSQLLPSILQSFHCQQPDAHIQVISAHPLDLVKDDLDFLLKADSAAEKDCLGKSEQLLLQEEILLALPREHPLDKGEAVSYEDTMKYTYVLPSSSTSLGNTLERYFEEKGLRKPLRTTEVNNSFLQCEFVSKGLGISLIPAKSWNYVYENRSIVLKNIKNWDLKRIVYLSSNPDRYQTELSKSFRQFLTAYFTELGTTGYEKCI